MLLVLSFSKFVDVYLIVYFSFVIYCTWCPFSPVSRLSARVLHPLVFCHHPRVASANVVRTGGRITGLVFVPCIFVIISLSLPLSLVVSVGVAVRVIESGWLEGLFFVEFLVEGGQIVSHGVIVVIFRGMLAYMLDYWWYHRAIWLIIRGLFWVSWRSCWLFALFFTVRVRLIASALFFGNLCWNLFQ